MTTILRRLLELIPTLFGVSVITFLLMRLTPGDPVKLMLGPEATYQSIEVKKIELGFQKYLGGESAALSAARHDDDTVWLTIENAPKAMVENEYVRVRFPGEMLPEFAKVVSEEDGRLVVSTATAIEDGTYEVLINEQAVDRNVVEQYLLWIGGILRGDLGTSITSERKVTEEIAAKFWPTAYLAAVSMIFAILSGLIVGILSAVYPRSWIDNGSRIFVFIFLAMPSFWLGLELIILFSRKLEWFPPGGMTPASAVLLPAITLGVGQGAYLSRILRSSMLQVMNQDYIRTARAKGVRERVVIVKHALKNALIPFVTIAGLSLGILLGGSVIVEQIFNWPGLGKLMIESIKERDYPVTMGTVLVFALIFVIANLIVDLLYVAIDPRIRLEDSQA